MPTDLHSETAVLWFWFGSEMVRGCPPYMQIKRRRAELAGLYKQIVSASLQLFFFKRNYLRSLWPYTPKFLQYFLAQTLITNILQKSTYSILLGENIQNNDMLYLPHTTVPLVFLCCKSAKKLAANRLCYNYIGKYGGIYNRRISRSSSKPYVWSTSPNLSPSNNLTAGESCVKHISCGDGRTRSSTSGLRAMLPRLCHY